MPNFPRNFRKVDGQIYAGAAPDAEFLKFFKETLGGRAVLSLDADIADKIAAVIKQLGMQHIVIPINSSNASVNDNVRALIRSIENNMLTNLQPIYIHCLHGRDRTGFAVALYKVLKRGESCQQALNDVMTYGYGVGVSPRTQISWKRILCALAQGGDIANVDDDIVQTMRDDFLMGDNPPAFTMQQSWAPYQGKDDQPPVSSFFTSTEKKEENKRKERKKNIQKLMEEIGENTEIPSVGEYNNLSVMRGFGPVENSGILTLI